MRSLSTILLVLICAWNANAQQTIVLQPGPEDGKDAMVWDDPLYNKGVRNFGDDPQLLVHAWTDQLVPVYGRVYLQFDLSGCPDMSRLQEATLYLYNNPEGLFDGMHQTVCSGCQCGINIAEIRCAKEPWDEHTINWHNRPAGKYTNLSYIPNQGTSSRDVVVDVTRTIREMYKCDPPEDYGFLIRLRDEKPHAALVFTSSDYHIPSRRPKLELTFASVSGTETVPTTRMALDVSPNPATEQVQVRTEGREGSDMQLSLYNAVGKLVFNQAVQAGATQRVPLTALSPGMYFFRLTSGQEQIVRPLVVR
ncbi:DNRLRE domain-containing protein [bacterium]|nr:DNRLRE domain-containing protein [bacterium]